MKNVSVGIILVLVLLYIWIGDQLIQLSYIYNSTTLASVGNAATFTGGFVIFTVLTYYLLPEDILRAVNTAKDPVGKLEQ